MITEFSFRKSYHMAYMSQLRVDLKSSFGLYETNHLLEIPMCMVKGSLMDATNIASGRRDDIIAYLKQQRLKGVEEYIRQKDTNITNESKE